MIQFLAKDRQISRFCVERCYIMHKVLHEIETGNWKERAEFRDYNTALQGVNDQDESNNMTTIFFQRFRHMFDKHVAPCWRSDAILHYIIGGNPILAKEFVRWLDYNVMMKRMTRTERLLHFNSLTKLLIWDRSIIAQKRRSM